MTLGWGAACVDGVVLITDSMGIRCATGPDGALSGIWGESTRDKLHWLDARVAFSFAGSLDAIAGRSWYEGGLPELDDVARQIFRQLLERRVVTPQQNELQGVDLLVGGGPTGRRPALWVMRRGRDPGDIDEVESLEAIPVGSSVGIGYMSRPRDAGARVPYGAAGHISDELTVDTALGLGIRSCHGFVYARYRQCGGERLGDFPGSLLPIGGQRIVEVAFPLQVAVITAEGSHQYEVALLDDVTLEDVEAAKALQASVIAAEAAPAGAGPGP